MYFQYVALTFDHITKQLVSMENLQLKLKIPLHQNMMYYYGFSGNNSKEEFWSSGAYVFRPNDTEATGMVALKSYIVKV